MKAGVMIALLQGIIEQDGDKQVRVNGELITGVWIHPPSPTTQERYIALSTGRTSST